MKEKYRPSFAAILAQSDKKHLFRGIDQREMVGNSDGMDTGSDASLDFEDNYKERQKK